MKQFLKLLIGILFLVALSISCKELELNKDVPKCIEKKINAIKKSDPQNPPATVWEWVVDGKTYYYFTSGCCDQYNYLYDDDCNQVCAPDGGFTGMGDGKCPEFIGTIEKTLVWEDDRQ